MQNKTAIWVFTILLTVACLYQLSFGWIVSGVEKKAKGEAAGYVTDAIDSLKTNGLSDFKVGNTTINVLDANGEEDNAGVASLTTHFEQQYLSSLGDESVYPLLGHSYQYCKNHQLNFGLDLQGGMAVSVEVSLPELVYNLAGEPEGQPTFKKPYDKAIADSKTTEGSFVDIFAAAWDELNPNEKMSKYFATGPAKGRFKSDMSNSEIVAELRVQASEALDDTENKIMNRINKFGVSQPSIVKKPALGRIDMELAGLKDVDKAKKLIEFSANLSFWSTANGQESGLIFNNVMTYLDEKEEIKATIDSLVTVVNIPDSLLTSVDSLKLSTDTNDVKNLAEITAKYTTEVRDTNATREFNGLAKLVLPSNTGYAESSIMFYVRAKDTAAVNKYLSDDNIAEMWKASDILPTWDYTSQDLGDDYKNCVALHAVKTVNLIEGAEVEISGEDIDRASGDYDAESGGHVINMTFTPAGASKWAELTANRLGKPIAIVMDNQVYSAPNTGGVMNTGICQISGGGITKEESEMVATVLNTGSLMAPAKIIASSEVGPTRGEANIKTGLWSFAIAIALVLMYMIFYYAKAGIVADIALVANIFFIFGTLASLGAALTLPGIAGIVLTIGMSVDANVLIYERIREEMRAGKGARLAITDGYKHAYTAIIDANLTTLFTAIVLAYFGSGPIKGFAVTLIIGIFTSLFSAIFITRLLFTYLLDKKKDISFSTKMTEKIFVGANYNFVGKRRIFYIISGIILVAGIGSLATKGLNYGIEFSGGKSFMVKFEEAQTQENVKASLTPVFENLAPEVKSYGSAFVYEVKTKYLVNEKGLEGMQKVETALDAGISPLGAYTITGKELVDPVFSKTLVRSSLFAIVLSLIVIFAYIAFRFKKWQYGLGALVAMFHDVLIVLSLFSIFYGILPFDLEIDQAFIAAILTVVGYSINDTVVVFDRIREYLGIHRKSDHKEVINKALNSTLSRTINTSLSTFMVLLIIFIFATDIRSLTFALMIGVVVGTYSSLCIASPSVIDLSKNFDENTKGKKLKK